MMMQTHFSLRLTLLAAVLLVGGCATRSDDGGISDVSVLTQERISQPVQRSNSVASVDDGADHNAITQLLAKPLTADSAVQIALRNNRGLQASFADLGVSEADAVQAGRMRNPGFSFSRLKGGGDSEIDRSVMFDLVGLLTLPVRSGIEQRRFEQTKLQAASTAIQLAADTRSAYFNAVAAQQHAVYAQQVMSAAEAGADLAKQMAKVGNWSKLDQTREQVFYAEATAQYARAKQNATSTREQLTRLLGLSGADIAFQLPDRLPDLPPSANEFADLESLAMTQRLDVQMARRDADATASALGLTKATGFINVFDAGYINKSESGKPRENGYEISLELPIFDWGGARTAKAEAIYIRIVHQAADTAVRAQSEVREAYAAYRISYDLARHYRDEVVPLRKRISDEVLLRYNGMLASVFELLADSREQMSSVNAAIEAQHDFWLAENRLQSTINGGGTAGKN
jgi:outer membrane protein TolC